MRNYGYIAPEIEEKAYILGSARSAPFEVILESGDWRPFLPEGEIQRRGNFDTFSCTNFGWLNLLEIYGGFVHKDIRNWAERFTAIVSGQKREGNDPQKVAEAIRTVGVVEEKYLPFLDGMTWETYFRPSPMIKELLSKSSEWLDEYEFKHEYIFTYNTSVKEQQRLLLQALKRSPVGVAVTAWVEEGDRYVKPQGMRANHWTVLVAGEEGKCWWVYDSYTDEGSYLKKLDWNYDFELAKGFYLHKYTEEEKQTKRKSLLSTLNLALEWLKQILFGISKKIEKPIIPIDEVLPPPAPKVEPPKYEWDAPAKGRHSVRIVCDEEGLKWEEKNLICAIIGAETIGTYDPKIVSKPNKNGTRDWGICQFNDGKNPQGVPFWIGAGARFPSTQYVLDNPVECIREMINQYKKGRISYWSSYNNKSYLKYL